MQGTLGYHYLFGALVAITPAGDHFICVAGSHLRLLCESVYATLSAIHPLDFHLHCVSHSIKCLAWKLTCTHVCLMQVYQKPQHRQGYFVAAFQTLGSFQSPWWHSTMADDSWFEQ